MLTELCEAMKTNTHVRSFSLVATGGDPIANVRLAGIPHPLLDMHPWQGCQKGLCWGAIPINSLRRDLLETPPLSPLTHSCEILIVFLKAPNPLNHPQLHCTHHPTAFPTCHSLCLPGAPHPAQGLFSKSCLPLAPVLSLLSHL